MTVGSSISPEMILVLLLLVLLQLPGPRRLAHLAAHDPPSPASEPRRPSPFLLEDTP